jgi:hypothetical protein
VRKILRRIYGPVVEQGIWKIRTSQEMWELCKDLDVVADTKRNRTEWTGHVIRMDQESTVKKIFESKPERSRRRGRPSLRWLEDAEEGLREMQVRSRRRKTVDREDWA